MYIGFGRHRRERIADGDAAQAAAHGMARLSREEKAEVRRMKQDGAAQQELTEWFFSGGFFWRGEEGNERESERD